MKKVITTPGHRPCFFRVGTDWFADWLYAHGHPLEIDSRVFGEMLLRLRADRYIIGRRLSPQAVNLLLGERSDAEDDVYARVVPDARRWRLR